MKKELIAELFEKFEHAAYEYRNFECWSARELQVIFEYTEWRNFVKVIDKAKNACENAGERLSDHFVDINKMIVLAKGAERQVEDIALTRYGCYLIAQNADPAKSAVAFAQTYFAVQTRKQEIIEKRLLDVARISAREKLSKSEKKLSGIIYEREVGERGFAVIRSKGDQALFGGFSTDDMKRKLEIPGTRPLADFLPTLTIKAKDFGTELTSHNVLEKDLRGEEDITEEHVDNNKEVRKMLLNRGVKPEALPAAEDVKKVQRRVEGDKKKMIEEVRRGKNGGDVVYITHDT